MFLPLINKIIVLQGPRLFFEACEYLLIKFSSMSKMMWHVSNDTHGIKRFLRNTINCFIKQVP